MFLENLDWGAKPAALCRTDSVLVSSSTWPKAFLVRSLVGPSFLGFVLFILPRGSSALVETAGWEGTALFSCPIPALAVGAVSKDGPHQSWEKSGDTARMGEQVMQAKMEAGHAGQVEMLMVMAELISHWEGSRVGMGFFAIVKHEVTVIPERAMVLLVGRAGVVSSAGVKRQGHCDPISSGSSAMVKTHMCSKMQSPPEQKQLGLRASSQLDIMSFLLEGPHSLEVNL